MKDLSVEGTSTINTEVTEFKYDPEAEFKERLWSWHGMLEEEDSEIGFFFLHIFIWKYLHLMPASMFARCWRIAAATTAAPR